MGQEVHRASSAMKSSQAGRVSSASRVERGSRGIVTLSTSNTSSRGSAYFAKEAVKTTIYAC
jgi:hypothetical protein